MRTWRGEERESPFPAFDDSHSLMLWGRTYYGEALAHLELMSDHRLSEPMPLKWASMVERALGCTPEPTTVGDTTLQVTLHSTYHRGQINARLREVGGEPPLVNYVAWVWMGRPAPGWPSGSPSRL